MILEYDNESVNYLNYYDLEWYLFGVVGPKFHADGFLSAFDFFCIVIWKANRAKSRIAKRLCNLGDGSIEESVRLLTSNLARQSTSKDRMQYLFESWGFRLPMASAILTVLYTEEFTIYDVRVCDAIGRFHELNNITNFENLWQGYISFKQCVENSAPGNLNLRDKDRYLWGKSFHDQLVSDIEACFRLEEKP